MLFSRDITDGDLKYWIIGAHFNSSFLPISSDRRENLFKDCDII